MPVALGVYAVDATSWTFGLTSARVELGNRAAEPTTRGPALRVARVVVGETYTLIGPRHDLLEALGLLNVLLGRPRRHAREDGLERGHVRRRLRRALRQLLHLALGLLGPLLHGLDFLLVRDDLVVVLGVVRSQFLELRVAQVEHVLALLQQPARLGELRLEVLDLLAELRLKILGLPLGRGRAGLGRVLLKLTFCPIAMPGKY